MISDRELILWSLIGFLFSTVITVQEGFGESWMYFSGSSVPLFFYVKRVIQRYLAKK